MGTFLTGLLSYGVAGALLYIALLIHPNTLTHTQLASFFLPLIWLADVYSWLCGVPALSIIHLFWATDLLVFRNPRADFKVLQRKGSEKDEHAYTQERYPDLVNKRFHWALKLIVSFRFIGWETGKGPAKVAAPGVKTSRGSWLLRRILVSIICTVVLDGTTSWSLYDPYFLDKAGIDSKLPSFLPLYELFSVSPRLFRLGILGIQHYAMVEGCHLFPAILLVSLGGLGVVEDWWGSPDSWPPLMGNITEIAHSGLRGFWGKFWHQLFRNIFVDPGRALTRALNIQPSSTAGFMIVIATAFFVSSVFHGFTFPRGTPDLNPIRYAGFFWVHAICLLIEVTVSRIATPPGSGRPIGLAKYHRMSVRVLWTLAVFYFTIPLLASELVKFFVSVERPTMLFPMP